MSRFSAFGLITLAALLGGCASTPEARTAQLRADAPSPTPTSHSSYTQRVEQLAKRRGLHVIWVNPPARRPPAGG